MAGVHVILCVCVCLHLVVGQFGFFPQRGDRRIPSFGFGQSFFPSPNEIKNTLSNIFNLQHQNPHRGQGIQNDHNGQTHINQYDNRPLHNNQYDQNRPIYNNQYDQNRPIYNNQYDQNRPITNNQYDQNNYQYDPNRPIYDNQYDSNKGDYPYNQPNNVNFPNRGSENTGDNGNIEQPNPTNDPFIQPNQPEYIEPNDVPTDQNGYGYQDKNGSPDQGSVVTEAPNVNNEESANKPTFAPLDNGSDDAFGNKNGIPTALPSQFSTTDLPRLTPVPSSAKTDNYNFGSQGLFKEVCTTISGDTGSCLSILSCEPYAKLLANAKSNTAAVQVLRQAHCGFEGNNPKVCCPRPSIPISLPPTSSPTPQVYTASTPMIDNADEGKSLTTDFIKAFPAPPECGLSNASFSRVVGGVDAKLGDFPWMALLGYQERQGALTRWLCGGSLITSHHVMTAAHCIHNHEKDLYVVRLGELDLAREDEGATPIDVLIKHKIKHAGYNAKSFINDIGLLILQNDVQFTNLIRPICIPVTPELRANNFVNYNPLIAGWGDTEFRGPKATLLQVLQLPVVTNEFCAQAYVEYKAQVIDERVLCAGFKNGGKDACQGDSGGPLMQPIYIPQNISTYIYQIGVVSYGKRCAEAGFPGVYTRVTNFVPWLEENILGTNQ